MERSMGYRSTDDVLQRVQVATGEIYVSSFTCCLFERHKFPRHSSLSFLFLSICPSTLRFDRDSFLSSCIIAIAPREKLNLKLIDCRNEWYADCHDPLVLVSPSKVINAIQKKRLAREKRNESTENRRVRLSPD